jgi:hypothetical protein
MVCAWGQGTVKPPPFVHLASGANDEEGEATELEPTETTGAVLPSR